MCDLHKIVVTEIRFLSSYYTLLKMATGAAELDPLFVKALGYFWSKSADSTAKLKKMLDDAIEQSNRR